MDNIQFPVGEGDVFIKDATLSLPKINNATSTKQNLNNTTNLVVLVSDQDTRYYYHNCLPLAPSATTCADPGASHRR